MPTYECQYCGGKVSGFEGERGVFVGVCQHCGEGYNRRMDKAIRKAYEIAKLQPFDDSPSYTIPEDDKVGYWFVDRFYEKHQTIFCIQRFIQKPYSEAREWAVQYTKDHPGETVCIQANHRTIEYIRDGARLPVAYLIVKYHNKADSWCSYILPEGLDPMLTAGSELIRCKDADEMNAMVRDIRFQNWQDTHDRLVRMIEEEYA